MKFLTRAVRMILLKMRQKCFRAAAAVAVVEVAAAVVVDVVAVASPPSDTFSSSFDRLVCFSFDNFGKEVDDSVALSPTFSALSFIELLRCLNLLMQRFSI